MEGRLLRTKDIQAYFGCGINRALQIIRSDGFPKIKIGKRYYVPKEAFEKWVKDYTYKEYHL